MPKLKNPRHELLAKNIVKEKFNLTKAYQKTYPDATPDTARSAVHDVIAKDSVKSRVMELSEQKYGPEMIVEDFLSYRNATKPITFEGKVTGEWPDFPTRLENTKTVLKMYGVIGNDAVTNIDARSLNVQLDEKAIERLAKTLAEIKALTDGQHT